MPRISKIVFSALISVFITGCVEPYYFDLGMNADSKYVVDGSVTDQEGYQTVYISISSTIGNPIYVPLSNCKVRIVDGSNHEFILSEYEKGRYRVWIGKEFLKSSSLFKVLVTTESGVEIESDYDTLPESVEIDSIYYDREDIATSNPEKPLQGIQFYADINADKTSSHYFRWDIVETLEHHAALPITYYWNTKALILHNPPDSSFFYCWTTKNVGKIFTTNTNGLISNTVNHQKLNFVDNLTQRLTFCYSLLINQFVHSEQAYTYWNKLKSNSNDQENLYESQPMKVKGNLKCTSNPNLEVLGYFYAASVRTKRLFVTKVENLELYYPMCDLRRPEPNEPNRSNPLYMAMTEDGALWIAEIMCIECNALGGSLIKPDFWPN